MRKGKWSTRQLASAQYVVAIAIISSPFLKYLDFSGCFFYGVQFPSFETHLSSEPVGLLLDRLGTPQQETGCFKCLKELSFWHQLCIYISSEGIIYPPTLFQ